MSCAWPSRGPTASPIAYREFPVQVVPALRRDNFVISTWHGGLTAAELQYYRDLGLNAINTGADPGTVERLGALGFSFDWHFRGGEDAARSTARQIAMMPNWWRMLLNSETGSGGLARRRGPQGLVRCLRAQGVRGARSRRGLEVRLIPTTTSCAASRPTRSRGRTASIAPCPKPSASCGGGRRAAASTGRTTSKRPGRSKPSVRT